VSLDVDEDDFGAPPWFKLYAVFVLVLALTMIGLTVGAVYLVFEHFGVLMIGGVV
jgi:hypothetical protein